MPLQDSSPERRNLMATSLGFIAYYFGGGTVVENEVRIQVVNVSFRYPEVLAGMAWAAIFWFLLRYWQTHKGKYKKEIQSEISSYKERKYLLRFLEKRTGRKANAEGGFVTELPWRQDGKFSVNCKHVKNVTFSPDGRVGGYTEKGATLVYFDGVWGRIVLARMYIESAIEQRGFAEYVAPYLLFGLAIIGAIASAAL